MKSLREGKPVLVFATILVVLVLAPAENRAFVFHARPADFYGEMVLDGGADVFVVAKNSGIEPVERPRDSLEVAVVATPSGTVRLEGPGSIPPGSHAVLRSGGSPGREGLVSTDGAGPFRPTPLAVLTRADQEMMFVVVSGLVLAALCLGWLLTLFASERAD